MLSDPKCPECDKPNQFGELCYGCEQEINRINACEARFNADHGLYDEGDE